jgi:hypothetical protein
MHDCPSDPVHYPSVSAEAERFILWTLPLLTLPLPELPIGPQLVRDGYGAIMSKSPHVRPARRSVGL